jgi:hypothetical protein
MTSLTRLFSLAAAAVAALCLAGCATQTSSSSAAVQAGVKVPVDFNGVWETADTLLVVRPEAGKPPYTNKAQRWIDEFKRILDPAKDDTANYCGLQGMPWTMTGRARTYPVEIYHTHDRVAMFFEVFDSYRNIRINAEVPPKAPSSINGYSVAKWDGATLVVTTTALSERPFPNLQLRSEKAKITERWTRESDPSHGDVLRVEIEVDDPEIFTRPVHGRKLFKRSALGTVVGGYDCPDRLWRQHVEKRLGSYPKAP